MSKIEELTPEQLEEAVAVSAANFGVPENMWADGYGQVIKDGKPTKAGLKWYEKVLKGVDGILSRSKL